MRQDAPPADRRMYRRRLSPRMNARVYGAATSQTRFLFSQTGTFLSLIIFNTLPSREVSLGGILGCNNGSRYLRGRLEEGANINASLVRDKNTTSCRYKRDKNFKLFCALDR